MIRALQLTRSLRLPPLAAVLAVALTACGGGDSPEVASSRFESGACPSRVASLPELANARCGYLVVPENREKPNGRTIRLAVAIVPSVAQPPRHDPVVHMTGGPGGDALEEVQFLVPAGLNADRDLIVMGQRGTIDAEPALLCPEIDKFNAELVGLVYGASSTRNLHVAATKACHDRWVAQGVDLGAYNTLQNIEDFVDLRKLLKIPRWSIYGTSYGTYLALAMMRLHPDEIVSVMIDSVAPPGAVSLGWTWSSVNEALGNLFDACAAQPACVAKYGDVRSKFVAQVQRLEANPLTVTSTYTPGGPPVKVVLDGGALLDWMVAAGRGFFVRMPSAIQELIDGNPVQIAAARAAGANPANVSTMGYGLTYGVFCSEWIPFEPESQILARGLAAFPTFPVSVLSEAPQLPFETEDCAIWDVPTAPASIKEITTSNIPTLISAGSFDARTSPMWAKYAGLTLSKSTTIVIPGIGHWVLPQSDCAKAVLASFLSDPNVPPDTSCVAGLTPPAFQ